MFFNTIKCVTKSTSSHYPGHIIGNCIARHKIETRTQDTYYHENTKPLKKRNFRPKQTRGELSVQLFVFL